MYTEDESKQNHERMESEGSIDSAAHNHIFKTNKKTPKLQESPHTYQY
jgi:hypothetical protein